VTPPKEAQLDPPQTWWVWTFGLGWVQVEVLGYEGPTSYVKAAGPRGSKKTKRVRRPGCWHVQGLPEPMSGIMDQTGPKWSHEKPAEAADVG
jgi:hypothetical protein